MDWKDALSKLAVTDEPTDRSTEPAEDASHVATNKGKQSVTIFYERKGRGGKEATILADFVNTDEKQIVELASTLKRRLGTGGSARGGEILIQGDRRTALRSILTEMGFKVK